MQQYINVDGLSTFKARCDEKYLSADSVATKLYDELGTATDGAVNQATVTEELSKKADSDAVTAELVKKADSDKMTTELSKKLDSDATAVKATKLETARSLKVSLSSSAAQTFDGSSDAAQIGVAGTLPVANGGTGQNKLSNVTVGKATQLETARNIQTNLGSTTAGSFNGTASVSAGVTGTLGIANGGTGQTTAAGVRNTLGLGNTTGALPVANGGTGANAVAGARQNLFGDAMNTAAKAKYAITINDNWANGGYTTLQELRNFMGLGNTTGALPVANGGTGLTASPSVLTNLASTTAANVLQASPRPGVTGTLPVANGGTGKTNLNDVTVGAANKDGAGNVITDTYVTKTEFEETVDNIRKWRKIPIYGYRISKTEADPDARVEYILDAAGMTPAHMDFTTGVFDYGSWGDVWFVKGNKPCMLKYDGTVDYYLDPDDYTKKADGTASDVANIDYGGNAMAQIPLVWIYRYEDSNYYYEIVSPEKVDDNFKAYAHTDANGTIKPYFYHSLFEACGNTAQSRCIAGQTPLIGLTFEQQIRSATANGSGWNLHSWSQSCLIITLLTLLGKSTDTQAIFGGESDYSIDTQTLNQTGQFCFCISNAWKLKVFHLESVWGGSLGKRIVGIFREGNGRVYVKMTPEGTGYQVNSLTGYINTGLTIPTSDGKMVSAVSCSEYGLIPIAGNGSISTYYCDELRATLTERAPGIIGIPTRHPVGGSGAYNFNFNAFYWYANSDQAIRLSYV